MDTVKQILIDAAKMLRESTEAEKFVKLIHPSAHVVKTEAEKFVKLIHPSAHVVKAEEGDFEVWYLPNPNPTSDTMEVLSVGNTEDEAWENAKKYGINHEKPANLCLKTWVSARVTIKAPDETDITKIETEVSDAVYSATMRAIKRISMKYPQVLFEVI